MGNQAIGEPVKFRRKRKLEDEQQLLFSEPPNIGRFPPTRYQGSKYKLLEWIWSEIEHLDFYNCLDLFSGTACVSYLLKTKGKSVTSNDYLRCNQTVANALIVNEGTILTKDEACSLFDKQSGREYLYFIRDTFKDIFFLDHENLWLDIVVQNLAMLNDPFKENLAKFALYQSCLAKRPYNLFHRANLYMRTAVVERNFGNKATWDKSFPEHFLSALSDANNAVFRSGRTHVATCADFREVVGSFDLVYMDPPYLNAKGVGVDYLDFYHFLEGITDYRTWPEHLTHKYKHKPFRRRVNPWNNKLKILSAFSEAIEKFRDSIIVISYRSNGIPSVDELSRLLERHGRKDAARNTCDYKYVLSNKKGKEILLVSEP